MDSADLTDEEIRAAYSAASRGSYDAINVMAGYRAIISADRVIRPRAMWCGSLGDSMIDLEELKPCPFCGSGVLHKNNPEKMGRTFFVSCGFCDCRGACLPTEQGAIDAWNTRADEFAAMVRDAERYRWLRDKSFNQYKHPIVIEQRGPDDIPRYLGPLCWDLLDKKVDAAMAERNK